MRCEAMLVGTALVLSTAPARAAPPVQPPAELPPPVRDDWIFGIDASVGPVPGLGKDVGGGALAARFGYRVNSRRAFVTPEAVLGLVVVARDFGGDFLHGEFASRGPSRSACTLPSYSRPPPACSISARSGCTWTSCAERAAVQCGILGGLSTRGADP